MGWLESLALAAFVAGLTGGVHCAAMCGGIVCMLTQDGKASGGRRWQFALAYNAGRILSYAFAGALAGSVGQAGLLMRGSMPVQQVFMLAAGITLCVMALYLAGLSPLIRKRRRIQSPRQRRQTGRDDQHEDEHATCYIVKGRGLVVISSCGHTGIINTVRSAMIA